LSIFYDNVVRGGAIKELVKGLLEESGYMVAPYGYESTFPQLRKLIAEKGMEYSSTARMLKSSPDILVYDDIRRDVMLVEVKMRSAKDPSHVGYLDLERYVEFWGDSLLALAVPCGNILYAQRFSDLGVKRSYDVDRDFERFRDVFPRVTEETIEHFKPIALKAMESSTKLS